MTTTARQDFTFSERLDRAIMKNSFKARVPWLAVRLIEGRRNLFGRRRREQRPQAAPPIKIDKRLGYALFTNETFPLTGEVIKACENVYGRHASEAQLEGKVAKPYLVNILSEDDLERETAIRSFARSDAVRAVVADYLPTFKLHSIGLFLSKKNDLMEGSQIFHIDGDASRQVKIFLNIWPVDESNGPFTFFPADRTGPLSQNAGLLKSLSQDDVAKLSKSAGPIKAVSAAGGGIICDTSRCLHQGSRCRENDRLVLIVQYLKDPDALITRAGAGRKKGGHLTIGS